MAGPYSDALLRGILTSVKTIALVGASAKLHRPSNGVMRFLQAHDYRVIPVNPGLGGQTLHGERVDASLAEIPREMTWSISTAKTLCPCKDEKFSFRFGRE